MRRTIYWTILILIIISISTIPITGCDAGAATLIPEENDDLINEPAEENIKEEIIDEVETSEEDLEEESSEVEEEENNKNTDSNEEAGQVEDLEEAEKVEEVIIEEEENPVEKEKTMYYSGNKDKMKVAITFDDGPSPIHTPEILKILKDYDIKATFFVLGRNASNNMEILKKVKEEGHEIGNHSWSHKHLPKVSKTILESEVVKTRDLLIDTFGDFDPIYRPPYGAVKSREKQLVYSKGYNIVNWSVDTRDWEGIPNEKIMSYVEQQLKPGGIILMHDGGSSKPIKNTVEVLPEMIEWVINQGYEFVTVSELLELN